jgi:hypothetical protein
MRIWPVTSSLRISTSLALVIISCLLLSRRASARDPGRVLVIAPDGSRLQRLLVGEIRTLGLEAIALPEATTLHDDAVTRAGGRAVLLVTPGSQGLEIWVVDRASGNLALRDVVSGLGESSAEDLAVLRTGELLRANLIEVPVPEAPPEPPAVPDRVTPAPLPAPEPRFGLSLGPAAAWGSRDLPPLPALVLQLSAFPSRSYALGVWATWSLPEQKAVSNGTALLATHLVGVRAMRMFSSPEAKWNAALGVGAALEWLHARGQSHPPYLADSDDHWTGTFLGNVEVGYAASPHFRILASLDAGASVDRTRLRVVGSDVAIWGPWLALGSVRAEVTWP